MLSGGEPAALVVTDAIARLLPGVLGDEDAPARDSFARGLLEHPQYTRPEVFRGAAVPEVLRSGDHGRIARWRQLMSLWRTWRRRPDLLETADLTPEEQKWTDGVPAGPDPVRFPGLTSASEERQIMEAIRIVEAGDLKKDRGGFKPGDTVKVMVKVVEGEKERLQAFEGVVIRRRGGGTGRLVHGAPHLLRGRGGAHVPGALAADRQDPGDEAGHGAAVEALLPPRAGRQGGAPQGEADRQVVPASGEQSS